MVDDRTWNDLDMDLIYGRLNQSLTIPGKQILYSLLRTPQYSRKPLKERSEVINLFIQDQKVRERIQIIFSKLCKRGGRYVVDLLWDERPAPISWHSFIRGFCSSFPFLFSWAC